LAYLSPPGGGKCTVLALDYRVVNQAREDGYRVLQFNELLTKETCWRLYNQALEYAGRLLGEPAWGLHRGLHIGRPLIATHRFYSLLLLAEFLGEAVSSGGSELIYVGDGTVEGAIARTVGGARGKAVPLKKSNRREIKYAISRRGAGLDLRGLFRERLEGLLAGKKTTPFLPVIDRLNIRSRGNHGRAGKNPDLLVSIFSYMYKYLSPTMDMLRKRGVSVEAVVMDIDSRPPLIEELLGDGYPVSSLADYFAGDVISTFTSYQRKWKSLVPEMLDWASGRFHNRGVDLLPALRPILNDYFEYWFPRLALSADSVTELLVVKQPRVILSLNVIALEDHLLYEAASRMGIESIGAKHGIGDISPGIFGYLELADKVDMASEHLADRYVEAGVPRQRVIATGSLYADAVRRHHFISHSEVEMSLKGRLPSYILFLPQPFHLQGYAFSLPIEKLISVCNATEQLAGYDLVVKLHRLDNENRYDYLRLKKRLYLTRNTDVLSLIRNCDALVVEHGTEISEALLVDMDIPIVLFDRLGLAEYMFKVGYTKIDYYIDEAFEVADSETGLAPAILRAIKQKGRRREARVSFLRKVAGRTDGYSWQRLGNEVIKLVNKAE